MSLPTDRSMLPIIAPFDKPVVEAPDNLKINDIVVFKKGERLTAHRIIYIAQGNRFIITKGDNNLSSDGKISFDRVLGKVGKVKRNGQKIYLSHFYLTQSSAYLKELTSLNKALYDRKIGYILLKGLPVHLVVEKTSPERLYLDADILIKDDSYEKILPIFEKLGYKPIKPKLYGKETQASQMTFIKATKPFSVAIDVHLTPRVGFTKVDIGGILLPDEKKLKKYFFENARRVNIEKARFPILTNEALFIFLLVHFFHHNFRGANRMDLINGVLKNTKLDWGKVTRDIKNLALAPYCYPSLLFINKYYSPNIPNKILSSFNVPAKRSVLRMLTFCINPFNSQTKTRERMERFLLILLLSPAAWKEKIKVIIEKPTIAYFFSTIKSLLFRSSINHS